MSKAPGKSAGKGKVPVKAAASKKAAPTGLSAKLAKSPAAPKKAAPVLAPAKAGSSKLIAKPASKLAAPKSPAPKLAAPKSLVAKSVTAIVPAKSGPKDAAPRTLATAKQLAPKKTESVPKKMAPRVKASDIVLPPDYRPADSEPFMNEMHRAYFRKRLQDWKDDILRQTRETLAILHEDSTQHADLADRATSETDRATELRTRDRQRKLISKIDAAISRIDDGSYGFCEDTGEPIGLKRLDARPIATLSVEAQERHERREKVYREE
jgi:DnaK suppressor protein